MANIKISELDAVTSLDGTELIEVVQGGTNKKATIADVLPYKVYTALLTQTGTDAPVATVLQNTLGGTVVWTYFDVGLYYGTLADAFTANKSGALISPSSAGFCYTGFENTSVVFVATYDIAGEFANNESLNNRYVRIEVYP